MKLQIIAATIEYKPVLCSLVELYAYDFSEMLGTDVGIDGRFSTDWNLECHWVEPNRHPFLFRAGEHWAGFALVNKRSYFSGDPTVADMDEFFVMRNYRRQGLGAAAAVELFNCFPGGWEVRVMRENPGARVFWRRVVSRYTDDFEEVDWNDDVWRGPVFLFTGRV